jgi:glycosyltransferase involved in cell wall biosynthesis
MLIGIDASRATVAQRTGTEVYSVEVIRYLLRAGSGHRFRLYSREALPEALTTSANAPDEARVIPFPRLWTHFRLGWEVRLDRPDVLFVPAHVLPLGSLGPTVVTIHDLGYLHFPEAHPLRQRAYLDWSTRTSALKATKVIADSQATRRDLIEAYGADPDKVTVVHLGRDPAFGAELAEESVSASRVRYGLAEGGGYLLYVGTLQPRKNLPRLVDAYARLVSALGDRAPRLVLAGKIGWMSQDLSAMVDRLGLAGRVVLPGYVAPQDLPAVLSGATAFVYPSLYEGFGLPVLEAGACGVPVITSNTSSLPEVAGDAAILVDPLDVEALAAAMAQLLTDDGLCAELSRKGRENARRFSWERCAAETLQVLEAAARPNDAAR